VANYEKLSEKKLLELRRLNVQGNLAKARRILLEFQFFWRVQFVFGGHVVDIAGFSALQTDNLSRTLLFLCHETPLKQLEAILYHTFFTEVRLKL